MLYLRSLKNLMAILHGDKISEIYEQIEPEVGEILIQGFGPKEQPGGCMTDYLPSELTSQTNGFAKDNSNIKEYCNHIMSISEQYGKMFSSGISYRPRNILAKHSKVECRFA